MNKLFFLTRVLIKSNLGMSQSTRKGSKRKLGVGVIYVLLLLCLLPLLGLIYFSLSSLVGPLEQVGQQGLILSLGFTAVSLLIFIFSIFIIPSVYFFSKDTEHLLCLPLKPQTILMSKFIVTLLYEFITSLFILAPLYIVYIQHLAPTPLYAIYAFFVFLTIPIFPLILSSIIMLIIMGFVPFFKNRDRFNMIAGILALAFGLGVNVLTQYASHNFTASQSSQMVEHLASGNNSLLSVVNFLLPAIPYASKALVGQSILNIVIYIGIIVLSIVIFSYIGKLLYFKGAIGFNETVSSRKELSNTEITKLSKKQSIIKTYTIKELKTILRTPVYAINGFSSVLMMPILVLIMIFSSGASPSKITDLIQQYVIPHADSFFPYIIVIGIIIGIFLGSSSVISSTSISREGTDVYFMKYIPVPLVKQIQAKILCGVLFSWLSIIVAFLIVIFFLHALPVLYILLAFISALISSLLLNILGCMLDIAHPKLVWESEAAAMKRNMAGITTMLSGWGICALVGIGAYLLPSSIMLPVSVAFLVLVIVCIILLNKVLNAYATKQFENY